MNVIIIIIIIIIIIFITAIDFSPGGSSFYTSTDKSYRNKIYLNETIQITVNTSKHITRTPTQLSKQPHITKPTHTHTPMHYKTS
jgi:hypothetical protein